MPRGLWKEKLELEISFLATELTSLTLEADRVRFRYGRKTQIKSLPNTVVTEFLNWSTAPERILQFTRQYGPVWIGATETQESMNRGFYGVGASSPDSGSEWEFLLQSWRILQMVTQKRWESLAETKPSTDEQALPPGKLIFDRFNKRIQIVISDFMLFIRCRMGALPPERMKICKRTVEEGCDTPYFVATHLRQEYCSDKCAHWGLKAAKREWWKQQQKQLKGGKH